MKRFISMFIAIVMISALCLVPSSFAASETVKQEIAYTDLGNGITVETTIIVYENIFRSSTKKASAVMDYKSNGESIATVTLTATFGYDGSTAWVVSSSASKSLSSGWSYSGQSLSSSGGTAYLTATLKSASLGSVPVNISLTCSKSGSIS